MTAKGSLSGRRERLPHDAIVFVGDGHKALFLRNNGDEKFPNLVVEHYSLTTIRQLTSRALTAQAAPSNARQQIGAAV